MSHDEICHADKAMGPLSPTLKEENGIFEGLSPSLRKQTESHERCHP